LHGNAVFSRWIRSGCNLRMTMKMPIAGIAEVLPVSLHQIV
jgi:hypothetical protein